MNEILRWSNCRKCWEVIQVPLSLSYSECICASCRREEPESVKYVGIRIKASEDLNKYLEED